MYGASGFDDLVHQLMVKASAGRGVQCEYGSSFRCCAAAFPSLNTYSLDSDMKDAGHLRQGSRLSSKKGHNKPTPAQNRQLDDLLRLLTGKRVKAVLRDGLGLVGILIAVTNFEALLELDAGGRLVLMKHAIEYVEPVGEAEL